MGIDRIGGGVGPLPDSVSPLEEVSTSAVAPVESRPAGQQTAELEEAKLAPLTGEGETVAKFDEVMIQGEVMKAKLNERVGDLPGPMPRPADVPEPMPMPANLPGPIPRPADLPEPMPMPADLPGPMPTPAELAGSLQEPTGRQVIQEVASQPDPVPQGVRDVIAQQLADRPLQQAEPLDEKSGLAASLTAPLQERPDLARLDRPVEEAGKSESYMEKGPALRSELFKPRED